MSEKKYKALGTIFNLFTSGKKVTWEKISPILEEGFKDGFDYSDKNLWPSLKLIIDTLPKEKCYDATKWIWEQTQKNHFSKLTRLEDLPDTRSNWGTGDVRNRMQKQKSDLGYKALETAFDAIDDMPKNERLNAMRWILEKSPKNSALNRRTQVKIKAGRPERLSTTTFIQRLSDRVPQPN